MDDISQLHDARGEAAHDDVNRLHHALKRDKRREIRLGARPLAAPEDEAESLAQAREAIHDELGLALPGVRALLERYVHGESLADLARLLDTKPEHVDRIIRRFMRGLRRRFPELPKGQGAADAERLS